MVLNSLRVPECEVKHFTRAKYCQTATGETKLVQIQYMSSPVFRSAGFEENKKKIFNHIEIVEDKETEFVYDDDEQFKELYEILEKEKKFDNKKRSLRRAKTTAFEKILCNYDLDTFVTFTFSQEQVQDRTSWEKVYSKIRIWLNNRVTRNGLKYVMCAERHKKGGIHFHAIMNSSALLLEQATNAKTGKPLTHKGKTQYNIKDWKFGFSSAVLIDVTTEDREKVAKYIFKYMGKAGIEGKIGGRYLLTGGKLNSYMLAYGETPQEFFTDEEAKYTIEKTFGEIIYKSWSYI